MPNLTNIDVRPSTGIDRSPLDEVRAIQTLLADVYKDAGDGRTLFRELVQNADDAKARRLAFTVLAHGWLDAENSLLRGPALLVANDGPFTGDDREALHKAIGGSKEDDVGKIGTFGIGLKSVFHVCEAFLYIGAEESEWRAGVLNPWAGTGERRNTDPLHPDWDVIGGATAERLRSVTTALLGETDSSLLLWIPLRRQEHRDRGAKGRRYGLGEHCPKADELRTWFDRSEPAAMLLAQCGHLRTIETARATGPKDLDNRYYFMRVTRQGSGWLGRYRDETHPFHDRAFKGEMVSEESTWAAVGVESLGCASLRRLRTRSDWPQSPRWRNGRHDTVPRKALAHAAVTVLRPVDRDTDPLGTRLRWAVFLPLDDDPAPGSGAIVECHGPSPAWEIILHGYFWPSQDRRSIPGVTDEIGSAANNSDMRIRWNRTLCEKLLLPLLPSALANAVAEIEERAARGLLGAVVRSEMLKNRVASVTRRHWLLPVVVADGVRWRRIPAKANSVLSIPKWCQAPASVHRRFAASYGESTEDVVFIDDEAPRLAGELGEWSVHHLKRLLDSIQYDGVQGDVFASQQSLRWIEGLARHVLGPDACTGDIRTAAFTGWLAGRIGEGALAPTTRRSASRDSREELRDAWRDLCAALPKSWIVETPVDSRRAVVELAKDGVIGEGLLPVPIGHGTDESGPTLKPDQDRLDEALSTLGRRLEARGESQRLRHSRLLLAETLLAIRPPRWPMGDHLSALPLLRVIAFPDEREEAWSVADLHRRIESRRVFAGSASQAPLELPSDPKRAAAELANALGETVWLVNGDAVAAFATEVPPPTPETLASAVLRAKALTEPDRRAALLRRLATASNLAQGVNLRLAARALLTGRAADLVGCDTELLHVPPGDEGALPTLLSLLDRSWCAVDQKLAKALPQDILDGLFVGQADLQALHRLLDECLDKPVDWTKLSDGEAVKLLRDLYRPDPEAQRRWRRIPLHRGVDGRRRAFNDRARRSTGKKGEMPLPPELRAEVRLLDPDDEIDYLYHLVPEMDRDGVLRLMLEASRPWRFAEPIVQAVRAGDGQIALPQDPDLRELLRHRCWLPDRNGGGLAPDGVLVAPDEVLDAASDLAASDAFGDKRLPVSVDPQVWQKAEPTVREILGRPGRARQVQRMADALAAVRVAQVAGGAWLVMPDPKFVDAALIECALETTLRSSHPGWKLVHTVRRLFGDDSEPLLTLAKALCAPVPTERQIEMLTQLAGTRPAKDSPGGRLFNRLLGCFADTGGFSAQVLPNLDLPTQDGNWHASRDVARTETGVSRRHRLIAELRPVLRLPDDDRPLLTSHIGGNWSASASDTLEKYFEPWHGQLRHGAVGAFLSLLGNGLRGAIAKLAGQWLGKDVSIEGMRSGLLGPDEQDPCAGVSVWISPRIARGDRVSAVNVLGSHEEMGAEPDGDTLFAIDPERRPRSQYSALAPLGAFWEIALRDVEPQNRTSAELTRLLGGTVERWASVYLKLDRERVNAWWSRWGNSSEVDLGPVLASIKAHLPLTLRQLDIKDSEPLRNALREAEQTQRKREQAPSDQTLDTERKALERLAAFIEEPEHRAFLWKRVNELMRRYGYGKDSVLLELAQNADDALVQAGQIKGEPLSPATRRLLIRVHERDGTPTVDVMHWGRSINDTGGTAFPAGRDLQWDQDLYFMMLMNLSSKPGEAPEDASSSSTTGRFGLGFKSVHLVSSSPSVVSGFIAFAIAGGLLPREGAVPDDADSWMIEGRRATRIRLPLRQDVEAHALMRSLFDRFSYARALLPVFARQVREVVVEGGPFPGVHAFDGKPFGAPGWSVGVETELPDHAGRWRLLRFRPADAGRKDMGTAAVAVGLRDGVPTPFGPDVPFLWNVTPTSENWGCGYVVNGPFKLDPGRSHVSLGNDTTLQAVSGLGRALGNGLIELHDVLTGNTEPAHCPLAERDGQSFLASLWRVLASGIDNSDKLRRSFLHCLHGNRRGISAWMAARSIVPTDLPAPFPTALPPISADVSWKVAGNDLGNPDLCAALTEVDDEDFRSLVGSRRLVSETSARLLSPLCDLGETEFDRIRSTLLGPCHLLAELAERWDYCLTPARLHSLRPLAQGSAWDLIYSDPQSVTWRGRFRARSADGSFQPLRKLLLREVSGCQGEADGDLDEELRRSAFAPDSRILDPVYIEHREDWRLFRWLRVQHRVDSAEVASWYMDVEEDLRPAALSYLLDGELREHVLSHLAPFDARPPWLQYFDDVRQVLEDLCEELWRRQRLLGALFPDRFAPSEPPPESVQIDPETFFINLLEWWNDGAVRSKVIADYERRAWPEWLRNDISDRLQADSVDHWLALLVLGACRSLGRARDEHHRGFLEWVHGRGWWDVFKTPDDSDAWMAVLRGWQDEALAKLTYPRWMSLFPAIHQLSRYRDVYVRLLKSAGRRREHMYRVTRLLAPRVDEALTGAGTRFDAPPAPLNMGLHWVLRELVRLDVVKGEHLFPDCWVPSEHVLSLLGPLGLDHLDTGMMSNSEKARAIFDFLASELGTPNPSLHRAFDIPLRYVASNEHLRNQFGLAQ